MSDINKIIEEACEKYIGDCKSVKYLHNAFSAGFYACHERLFDDKNDRLLSKDKEISALKDRLHLAEQDLVNAVRHLREGNEVK